LELLAGLLCAALCANAAYLAINVVQLHSARSNPAVSPTKEVLGETINYPVQTTLEFIGVHSFFKFSRAAAKYSFAECGANETHVCGRRVGLAAQLYYSYPESPTGGVLSLEQRATSPQVRWGCLANATSGALLMCGTSSQNRVDYEPLTANLTDGTLLLHFSPKGIQEGVAADHHSEQLMQIAVADMTGSDSPYAGSIISSGWIVKAWADDYSTKLNLVETTGREYSSAHQAAFGAHGSFNLVTIGYDAYRKATHSVWGSSSLGEPDFLASVKVTPLAKRPANKIVPAEDDWRIVDFRICAMECIQVGKGMIRHVHT
jgi:hypothetical protein